MEFKLGPQETLTRPSVEWNFETDKDAELLEQALIDFMIENRGIGLAANQVGLDKRVFVIGSNNILGFPKPFAVFNPKIIEVSQEQCLDKEGCLSFPDLWLTVKRPEWIIAQYQDSTGNLHEVKMDGYIARCFQHEYDHLDGICFVDKVSQMKLQLAMKKLRKTNK
jgi:peptide deformylase